MTAAPKLAVSSESATPRPAATPPTPARPLATRLGTQWLPHVAWAISRTGGSGLAGIALLLAAAVFFVSTHVPVAAEVESMRAELAQRQGPASAADQVAGARDPARPLPGRADLPAILRQIFGKAGQTGLVLDSGKYEITSTAGNGVVRHQIAFPVNGPYPKIRAFIDATLANIPALALNELVLDRKAIGDAEVAAQVRFTVYTGAVAWKAVDRVVPPTHAPALFASHSWYVPPPPPPPAAPPPPPEPTAPPFPYAVIGSYAPQGHPAVFFLSQGERVIDAHVGDVIDGVYKLESAAAGQLVFVYLPLNVRQTLAAGASP
jgi:hypothetical protein